MKTTEKLKREVKNKRNMLFKRERCGSENKILNAKHFFKEINTEIPFFESNGRGTCTD